MLLIDKSLKIFAPHECLGCELEGDILCQSCRMEFIVSPPSRCAHCQKLTTSYGLCSLAQKEFRLAHLWVSRDYSALAKSLVAALKFQQIREAASVIAESMSETLPYLPRQTIIVPVPTTTNHRRARGLDHTQLISRELSRCTGLGFECLLGRIDQHAQVGSKSLERKSQLNQKMYVTNPKLVIGQTILLVDDVMTTGSTLKEATRALRAAGAARVNAAVFAQKVL